MTAVADINVEPLKASQSHRRGNVSGPFLAIWPGSGDANRRLRKPYQAWRPTCANRDRASRCAERRAETMLGSRHNAAYQPSCMNSYNDTATSSV